MPSVSVLMPVYNAERYVAQAIESILGQTFSDFELLIIDDGSSDRSLEIARKYADRDRRVSVATQRNRGISATRNELLRLATGELVAVMDSDDVALPDRLARQVAFLSANPQVVCVGGSYRIIDSAGRLIHRGFPVAESDDEIQRLLLAGQCSLHHPTALLRSGPALRVGGYDEQLAVAGDSDLWLRLGEVGALANLREPVLDYRIHGNSISDTLQERAMAEVRGSCDRAWKRRGITGTCEVTSWRPSDSPKSRSRFFLLLGWWAFDSGERQTARLYAMRAIRSRPLHVGGWKLLACAALKDGAASSGPRGVRSS